MSEELFAAFNTACRVLPEGYIISLRLEKDAGWVELETPDSIIQIESDGDLIAAIYIACDEANSYAESLNDEQ